jgi:mycothiol system anti-sigma-R factor
MTCQECIEALHMYIDRELDEHEIRQVELHLKDCADCDAFFDFKKELKVLVHKCCQHDEAPAALRERILRMQVR